MLDKSWYKKQLSNWSIPIVILILLALFGLDFVQYIAQKLILAYYKNFSHPVDYNVSTTGQIGDTFGGTIGPIIAIIASYLTFLAFWVQYRANQQQKRDLQIERFENKFYQMVQIHRNNVTEIVVGKSTSGRKAFISFFSELKFTYLFISNYYNNSYPHKEAENLSDDEIYNISYLVFFFGYGPNSSKIINDLAGDRVNNFFLCLEEHLENLQKVWKQERKKKRGIATEENQGIYTLNTLYKPFNGHMSKLSHYIRHIYQLVKYVDENYPDKDNYTAKYQYITTLRSQLSTFEQLIIYYNALSVLGQPWLEIPKNESEFLLKKYCLIKSMPVTLADFYKNPEEVFGTHAYNKNGITLFEWGEIKTRFNNLKK